jgi:hypothetical protein
MERDKEFICKKLGLNESEFEEILKSKPKLHTAYPSIIRIMNRYRRVKQFFQNNRD